MRAISMPVGTGRQITIVSASVGAGHDGAAGELARRLRELGFSVDTLDFLDMLPVSFGRVLRQAYALQLRVAPESWGQLFAELDRRPRLAAAAQGIGGLAARRLRRRLRAGTTAVVSTYPLASQALGVLRRRGLLDVPTMTYLTDLSVHPLWVAEGVDTHLALHPVAAVQALRLGAADVRVAAPAVRPAFRPAESALERDAARLRFGLPEEGPLALVVAGSWGTGDIVATARDLAESGPATPVVVCGRNEALRKAVTRSGTGPALGWVDDMPALMRACDVVVQNAGGLSSLEALATGLPVVSYRCLPGHGSTNAAALDEAGWAPWARRPEELPGLLAAALTRPVLVGPGRSPGLHDGRLMASERPADPAALIAEIAGGAKVPDMAEDQDITEIPDLAEVPSSAEVAEQETMPGSWPSPVELATSAESS
ncbi:MAG TPA: glycosyltransferase [Actinomadura sp.]|nr:glycosyltransferase [Actinomadura sp.]